MAGTSEISLLDLGGRDEWRAWLERNHAASPGVWLVYYKTGPRTGAIEYDDSVREALCFGWVDSLIKRIDDERYARKFTPRKPDSKWSDSNRKRWRELEAAGLLRPAGLASPPTANDYPPRPDVQDLPDWMESELKRNPRAWSNFQKLAPTYRLHYVMWVSTAKREETRERRLREAIGLLEQGRKLGLK